MLLIFFNVKCIIFLNIIFFLYVYGGGLIVSVLSLDWVINYYMFYVEVKSLEKLLNICLTVVFVDRVLNFVVYMMLKGVVMLWKIKII